MDFDVIIVGSGFGACVVASELASRNPRPSILMLERGVWWFSPERQFSPKFAANFDASYPPGDRNQEPYTKHPVQYWPRPDHRRGAVDLLRASWANVPGGDRRDFGDEPQPLYRYNTFNDLDIVTASGVGGGSLIYSNVSIRPFVDNGAFPVMEEWPVKLGEPDYDAADTWMKSFRARPNNVVTKFPLDSVTQLPPEQRKNALKNLNTPDQQFAYLGKVRYLREAAAKLSADLAFLNSGYEVVKGWEPLDLAVIEYPDPEAPDLDKKAFCERQGRCLVGCLPGARHTLNKSIMNKLLYSANVSFIELRSLSEVSKFEKTTGGWRVHYDDLRFGDQPVNKRKRQVTAAKLVLAAGCLPTNQLMLGAKNNGLKFSGMLGRKFSTNGDFAGFIDYPRDPQDKTKFNPRPWGIFPTRGPINASHLMFRKGKLYVNFEDATIPPMFAPFVRRAIDVAEQATSDRDAFFQNISTMWRLNFEDLNLQDADVRVPGNYMTEHEMLQHTFFFNLMGNDRADGKFTLDNNNKLQLGFETGPLAQDPVYQRMEEIVQAMVKAMGPGGKYVRFPFWGKGKLLDNQPDPQRKFVTVHPLGGCRMATNSTEGVVNEKGQVFDTNTGASTIYEGLYIADASVVPGPLAVNPTLTIVAMAKRIAANVWPAVAAAASPGT